MKVVFFGIKEEDKIKFFKENLSGFDVQVFEECVDEDNLPKINDFEVISIFVHCTLTPKVIDSFPNLKFIAIRSTGFDNVDIEYAKQKGIIVSNVPAYGSHTVAEFAFGLILSLSRKIPDAIRRIKYESLYSFENLSGFDLFGKTLGVVGTGKIGSNVIRIALGFGMKVLAFDPFPNENLRKELQFQYVSLDELLKNSDIITLHCPYSEKTHHLINSDNIFNIKQGAYLVNTSRGAVIETESLFKALNQNHLSGAALDVLEAETELKEEAEMVENSKLTEDKLKKILEDHILMDMPNVLVTPHMAFYTKEAEQAIMDTTVTNIKSFLENSPQNLVNG